MLGLSGKSTALAASALAVAVAASTGRLRGGDLTVQPIPAPGSTPPHARLSPDPAGTALWRGADPWVTLHDGQYFWCGSARDRIEVWRSDRLDARGERRVVWTAPKVGWNRAQVWAPELHLVRGRWYI